MIKGDQLRLEELKKDTYAPVGYKSILLRYEDARDFPKHLTVDSVKIAFEEELGEGKTRPGISIGFFFIVIYVPKETTTHQAMNCLRNVRAILPINFS